MTVVFRPAHLDPVVLTEPEVFNNGERILAALIHTEHLPKGFPTEFFAPQLVNGSFAIRIAIDVAPGKLLVSPQHQQGHLAIPVQPLSYGVFAKEGLPLSLPVYEPGRGFVARGYSSRAQPSPAAGQTGSAVARSTP